VRTPKNTARIWGRERRRCPTQPSYEKKDGKIIYKEGYVNVTSKKKSGVGGELLGVGGGGRGARCCARESCLVNEGLAAAGINEVDWVSRGWCAVGGGGLDSDVGKVDASHSVSDIHAVGHRSSTRGKTFSGHNLLS